MKLFKHAFIVGTGLIGGSLGMALKAKGLVSEVSGFSFHKKNALLARSLGAIDRVAGSFARARQADLIIFATPVSKILELAMRMRKFTPKDCLVIDVGSTKAEIVSRLSKIFPVFVGCHPLAGSERKGISHAQEDIFKGSICLITPVKNTPDWALKKTRLLWEKLGSKPISITPLQHDRAIAFTSHLPHAVAFSLMSSIPGWSLKFASSSLKDTTRIAASDEALWSDIFMSNAKNLLRAIGVLELNLGAIKSALKNRDRGRLLSILSKSREKREKLG